VRTPHAREAVGSGNRQQWKTKIKLTMCERKAAAAAVVVGEQCWYKPRAQERQQQREALGGENQQRWKSKRKLTAHKWEAAVVVGHVREGQQ
jgi:hypothetical protein